MPSLFSCNVAANRLAGQPEAILYRRCAGPPRERRWGRADSFLLASSPFRVCFGPVLEQSPEVQKQKIGSQCNFFAIRDCLETPDCGLRRKSPGNLLHYGSISLFGNGKESAIAKKLQKCRDFCFCSGLIVETRRIPREEHGVLPVKAAARHCRCH